AALPGATLRFAAGYRIDGSSPGPATDGDPSSGPRPATGSGPATDIGPDSRPGPDLMAEAVTAATGADVLLVFLGLPPAEESEGYDRAKLDLPDAPTSLLEPLAPAAPAPPRADAV